MGRAGYLAETSPYKMHHLFASWVSENEDRFRLVIKEGERVCGEWLTHAHGTLYNLPHEPFVAFDIFDTTNTRFPYSRFVDTIKDHFVTPWVVNVGGPVGVQDALNSLGEFGRHGALENIEGAVWRVERKGEVDFLCKYVRPDKIDGKYLKDEKLNTWIGFED